MNRIKDYIPSPVKYALWILFKSRQRRISWLSLFTDLYAFAIYIFRSIFPEKKLQMVSICTGIYNRSDNYLNQLLKSLDHAKHKQLIELSVFDCGSNDVSDLEHEIRKKWKGRLVFNREAISFTRSYSFNKAVAQAEGPIVFLCDSDISLPDNIVSLCNNYTGKKRAWYPIYFYLFRDRKASVERQNGEWAKYEAKGTFACIKDAFNEVGKLDESFKSWGGEDIELWERFYRNGYVIIRQKQKNMFHHWHDSHHPIYSKMNQLPPLS